jgi:hypothetical protein
VTITTGSVIGAQRVEENVDFLLDIGVVEHLIGQPEGHAIDQRDLARAQMRQRLFEIQRRLHRAPALPEPARPVLGDFGLHLIVMGLGRRDVDLGQSGLQNESLGEGGFARRRATDDQREGGEAQFSFPKSEPNDVCVRITR